MTLPGNATLPSNPQPALDAFLRELDAVQDEMTRNLAPLYTPLLQLVHAQLHASKPHWRAAFVLAAAFDTNDSGESQRARHFLAAALEMLFVALNIHKMLLVNEAQRDDHSIDKSVLGSTILAGDYCFSCAASLAAQTNSAEVVAIFSRSLQAISEEQLRSFFQDQQPKNFETSYLLNAGAEAASHIAALTSNQYQEITTFVQDLSIQLSLSQPVSLSTPSLSLTLPQIQRWQAFVQWAYQQ